jgi:hypothetical protein
MVMFSQSIPHRAWASRSHHHSHGRRSTKRKADPHVSSERRIQIKLVDLDDLRDPITIGVRETSRLDDVAVFLKHRYDDDGDEEPVPEEAQVKFYWMDKCLLGNEIPSGMSTLHYRVFECDDDDGDDENDQDQTVQVIWSSKVHLSADQLQEVRSAIRKGETVGGLRRILASFLNVQAPNEIVISARGGLRPGLLQGNNWKVNKVNSWLCRTIWIDIAPVNNYFVLKGVNEEYVYHPPLMDNEFWVEVWTLRNWLISRILENVHHRASSRLKVDTDDITLLRKGRILSGHRHVRLGRTIHFEVTRSVADNFIAEEAWLVPQTETCIVCGDDKRVSEMPMQITKSCEHEPNTCKDCISQWITSSMGSLAWDRLKCPECPALLQFEDVKAFADRETFDRSVNVPRLQNEQTPPLLTTAQV